MPLLFAAVKLHAGKVTHGDEVEVCMLCVVAAGALGHLVVHGAGSDMVSCSLRECYRHIVLGHAGKHERMAVEQGGIASYTIHDKRLLMSTDSFRCNIKVCILVVERDLKNY
jgi:hypothetical protein